MILYKYVSFGIGAKILETSQIRFTQPQFFNDPFDLPAYPSAGRSEPDNEEGHRAYLDRIVGKWSLEMNWTELTGILCLTRTPTNPLMWAHYAHGHTGMVIGIDAGAAGFTDPASNLIPAQYGSIIYVSGRSDAPFVSTPDKNLIAGATHHFLSEHYELLQRLFLHKPLHWSYEEEVRVLKCLGGITEVNAKTQSGRFSKEKGDKTLPVYLYCVPPGSICEVYFGHRADDAASDKLYYEARARYDLSAYECALVPHSFSVKPVRYVPNAEANSLGPPADEEL